MIRIELDIPMPQACVGCFLLDDEFEYCHGHLTTDSKELRSYLRTVPYTKPDWCPLIEVRKSCTEGMLGAPFEICFQTQCSNYPIKKEKEKQWQNHVKECLKDLEKNMKLKGIIDCDFTNYKEPVLTLEFPYCDFKCDKLNGCQVCQNSRLAAEPNIEISFEKIWELYVANPLTKGFCCQGLEPFDSPEDLLTFIAFIRKEKKCEDPIIIYTGYTQQEGLWNRMALMPFNNIIIKWGRYIIGDTPHYDEVLGVNLASNNQYAKLYI